MMKKNSTIWVCFKMMGYFLKTSPVQWLRWHAQAVLQSVGTVASLWATVVIFDNIADIATGEEPIWTATYPILIFAGIALVRNVFDSIGNQSWNIMNNRNLLYMRKKVAEKAGRLDPIQLENPQTLDEINKAIQGIPYSFQLGDTVMSMTTYFGLFFLVLGIYLTNMDPRLGWAVALAIVPKLLSLLVKGPLYAKLEDKSAPLRRQVLSYREAMSGQEFLKETRMLGASHFFKGKYLEALKLLNVETWRANAKSATLDLLMTIATSIGYLGVIYLLFQSLTEGYISVGVFAAVFSTLATTIIAVINGIEFRLGLASQHTGSVANLVNFLERPESIGAEKTINWQGDLKLENITFTYPNATKPSLKNLSLSISPGETLAIVGVNGSGKSTLTKVLMGLYEPTSGEVLVGGKSLKGVSSKTRYRGVSAVFQKFQRYQMTLKENIQLGDINNEGDLSNAMEQAGVLVNSEAYPNGADTVLSREFEGVDLSGGQWQRVAIARGLYRNHDLIVLDEPTAAIDPIEESRLYEKFAEISKDKTAIIVTHRLGSAKIADRIVVMEDGQIAEIGSHEELLSKKSLYEKMYRSQEQWYMSA